MQKVAIVSVGHYLPKRRVTNQDLEKMVDTSDEWITTRTGIKERRIAVRGEKTSDMAFAAGKEALINAGVKPDRIELIVVATTTPDSNFPSVACLVQKAIGAEKAAAFDVSAACSGFLYALTTAKQFIVSRMYKNALVIGADKFTNIIDWNDRNTCVLFGDGAGAVFIRSTRSSAGILSDYLHAQGKFSKMMEVVSEERDPLDQDNNTMRRPFAVMRGKELFKIAVNSMSDAVKIAAKKAGVRLSNIKCVVPHQANDRIISAVAKKLELSKDRFFINIEKYGNMSAASIAVAFYEAVESGRIKKGDIVALVTFGAGLVTAANIVRL